MVPLLCPVRGCGLELARAGPAYACPRRHAFDIARSGYVNLLGPQDRRSRRPGDAPAAVAARRRLLERGIALPLVAALTEVVAAHARAGGAGAARPLSLLDVGCGEGYFLRALASRVELDAHGVDLSVAAVDAAARSLPSATLVVANADRFLPFASGSLDLATSIHARLNPDEMRRILRPSGLLVVAVPGPDDLVELRAAVLGEGRGLPGAAGLGARIGPGFVEEGRRSIRQVVAMDRDALADALAATYRGARRAERERLERLAGLDVTVSFDLVWLRPGPAP